MTSSANDLGLATKDFPTAAADPMPPGRLATWLFLASEVMFFVGLLGVYVIFRATPGNAALFAAHRGAFDARLAGANTVVLLVSSLTMAAAVDAAWKGRRRRAIVALAATLLLGAAFVGGKAHEYAGKLTHYTLVATDPTGGVAYAFDGHAARTIRPGDAAVTITGRRMPVGPGFDLHAVAASDFIVPADPAVRTFEVPLKGATWTSYGPSKNVVFATYFALTGVHAVHVLGGLVALLVLLGRAARGTLTGPAAEYVALYWYFVDAVWVLLFLMIY